jgi:hypothetical protein
MTEQVIVCPHCKKEIPLSEALSHEAREKMRLELEKELLDKERLLKEKEKELDDKVKALEEKARQKAQESLAIEMEDLKQQVKEKSKELQKAQKTELELRKHQREVEEKEKNLELELERKLDAARKEFKEKLGQEHGLELRQKEKVIEDLKNQLTEAQKRAEQGSQQLQGEVLELDLEETLRLAFPEDEIKRVPKGTRGADLLHKVCSPSGLHCGTIIWEAKRTKAWHGTWLDKLKEDQRRQKAELAVIASEVLPGEVQRFGLLEEVWVCDYGSVGPLAMVLRRMLIQVASEKRLAVRAGEKMESLHRYLTGTEFRQRVQVLVEAFITMKEDLDKEKRAMSRLWGKREKQIERVIDSIATMRGELEGIGVLLPQLPPLELSPTRENDGAPTVTYIEDLLPQEPLTAPDEETQGGL